jgi:hypothetical protein
MLFSLPSKESFVAYWRVGREAVLRGRSRVLGRVMGRVTGRVIGRFIQLYLLMHTLTQYPFVVRNQGTLAWLHVARILPI